MSNLSVLARINLSTMSCLTWILLATLLTSHLADGYRALVLFPLPSRSHSILGDNLVKLISEAGNEVTYVTTMPREKPLLRVKEIDISSNKELFPDSAMGIKAVMNKEISLSDIMKFITMLTELSSATLQNAEVQKLLKDPNERFDVVIAEWMYNDVYAGLAPLFGCPFIWLSTIEPHWKILRLIDELPSPAYTADGTSSNDPPFTFFQRVQELQNQIAGLLLQYTYTSNREVSQYESIIVPILRARGYPVPDFEDLRFNASLVLGNSHVSTGIAIKLPQIYKPVGGYHISSDVKPLPEDLEKLFRVAKHGVIYFSLGSNLKSKSMPDELKQSLLKMFGGLKQTILWKFEEDLPNRPSNVHIVQWAPQTSILAHNNCVLFMTHGGMLSTIEAVHFGKPIVAIPIFGDQFSNSKRAVKNGYAKMITLSYTMADDIKLAIQEVLENPSYAAKVKELSVIYHDRPVPPGKELVHWVQHVVTTRGALHLRSPALQVPWYQKWYLDLVFVIIGVLYALKLIAGLVVSKVWRKADAEKKKN